MAGLGLVGVLTCSGVIFAGWLRTDAGARWTDRQVVKLLGRAMTEGHPEVGTIRVDLAGLVHVTDFRLVGDDGADALAIDELVVRFVPSALLARKVKVLDAEATGVFADVEVDGEGVLELSRMFGGPSESTDPWGGLPVELELDAVRIRGGDVRYRTPDGTVVHVNGVNASARVTGSGKRIEVHDLHTDAALAVPGPLPLAVGGGLVYDDGAFELDEVRVRAPGALIEAEGTLAEEADLDLRVVRLDLARIDPVAGGAGLTGTVNASASLLGPMDDLRLVVVVEGTGETEGTARLRLGANAAAERLYWTATGQLDDVHVDHFLTSLTDPIVLGGDLDLKGAGTSWPADFSVTGRWEGDEQSIMGQTLEKVDVAFNLDEGVVYVDDTSVVEGIVGTIYPDGWYDIGSGLMDVNASGQLTPDALAQLGVEGFGAPGAYQVKVIGDTGGTDPLYVRGDATFAPFVYQDIRSSTMRADFALDVVGSRVGGTVSVDGEGIDAYGLTAGTLTGPALRVDVVDGHTTVLGDLTVTQAAYDPVLTAQQIDVALDVDVGEQILTQAQLTVGSYTFLDQPGTSGTGRVDLAGDQLTFEVALQDGGREELEVVGSYGMEAGEVDVSTLSWSPTPRIAWRLDHAAHLRTSESGGIEDADLALVSDLGSLRLQGALGASGPLDAEVTVEGLQLDMLSELYPEQAEDLSGSVSSQVRLTGTAEAPEVVADVQLADLYYGGTVRYLDAEGQVRWADDRLSPKLKIRVADEPLAAISGYVPLAGPLTAPTFASDATADLVAHIRPGSFERFDHVSTSIEGSSLPRGRVSAVVELSGRWGAPMLHTAGIAEVEVAAWRDPGRMEFDALYDAGSLSFWSDLREGMAQRANLGGGGVSGLGDVWAWQVLGEEEPDLEDYTLWLDRMFVSGVLLGVPARSLASLADAGLDVRGELVGGVTVSGSPYEPVMEGGIHWLEPEMGGTKADGAYAALTPAELGYELDLQLEFPADASYVEEKERKKAERQARRAERRGEVVETAETSQLKVSGPVPVVVDTRKDWTEWSQGDLALAIEGERLPLSLLQVADTGVQKAKGWMSVEGHVGGTLSDPAPVAAVNMEGASLQYVPLGLSLSELTIAMKADRERIELSSFGFEVEPRRRFRTSGVGEVGQRPRVRASGEAALQDWEPTSVAIGVKLADGAWLAATDDLTLRADGNLAVSGAWPALKVGGDLELVQGQGALDAATFLDTAPLELDPRIAITRDEKATVRAEEEEEPPFYSDFLVDVDVDLKRNLEVDVSMPFIDDLGSLGAAVTRADVSSRLGGELTATLTGGELDLVGEVEVIEGKVRVLRSSFSLQEGTVAFTGGDPFNPVLDLSAQMSVSDATVDMNISGTPEQPEIQFSSEQYPDQTQIMTILLTGQAPDDLDSSQGQGTAQALAQLLLNSVFAGQSLGSFSIEPDGSVRLGVPISQAIYASSTLAPTQNPTENRLSVGLEWSLLPKVVASGAIGDRRSSADVYWEIRF